MTNSSYIEKNNRGVDALYAGDLPRGYQILSQVFFECVKNRHTAHQLKMESRGVKTSVEFALQDCSRGLLRSIEATRGLSRPGDVHGDPSGSRTFLALNFLRIEIPAGSTEQVNDLCSCAVAWALGHK